MVSRHAGHADGRCHHRPRMRGEVRRPQEARGLHRDGPVDARQPAAGPRPDPRATSRLLRAGPALHRPRRADRGRRQRVADRRVPGGKVRRRLRRRAHLPHGVGTDQGRAEAEAAEPAHGGCRDQHHEPPVDAHRPPALQRSARPAGHVPRRGPQGPDGRDLRGHGNAQSPRARRPQGVVPARGGALVTTSATFRRPSGSLPPRAMRTVSRAASASRPTARAFSSTRRSSC